VEIAPSRAQSPGVGPIKPHEIVAALPTTGAGIAAGVLMKMFSKRVGDQPQQTKRSDFIQMVKENSKYGPDKLLRRK
jgi:transcription initiation factor TFIIF subunit alpha